MKSTRMMEFLTMIPAPAMKPIMEVAVKNAPKARCPGRIPMSESGIGRRMARGTLKDWNQPITRMAMRTRTIAKAIPRSRNTSYVICHSPSHLSAGRSEVCGGSIAWRSTVVPPGRRRASIFSLRAARA